jgi:hypothetical protein
MGTGRGRRLGRGLVRTLFALGLAGGPAPAALANRQIDEPEATLEQAERDAEAARSYGELVEVRLHGGSEFVIGSDFGEFDATSYHPGGRVKLTLPVAHDAALRLVARGSAVLTDFDDVSTNLFGATTRSDPFGDLYATSFEVQGGLRPGWSGLFSEDERWTLVAELAARSRWEDGASFGASTSLGGALGVGYQIGDWLEVIAGAAVSTRVLGGGVSVHPIVELDWRFAERWRLRTRGRGGQLELDLGEDWTAFVSGRLERRSYLTADRPGQGEGRLRDRSVPVGLGLRWRASELVELTLTGGALLRREIRAEDEDGRDLGHVRAGPTPYLGIALDLRPERRRRAAAAQREEGAVDGSSSTSMSTSR